MPPCDCGIDSGGAAQGRLLRTLLAINGFMFVSEFTLGIVAESSGLVADSLDMLADALVYGIALYAVGRDQTVKIRAARWSGLGQLLLAVGVLVDIGRRLVFGSDPEPGYMLLVGAVALAANLLCLRLIFAQRRGEVHMRASWIFSKNDVIANLGVIVGGGLVYFTASRWPDLIIGLVITAVVFRGGLHILRDAASEQLKHAGPGPSA